MGDGKIKKQENTMLVKKHEEIKGSEITDKNVYMSRRLFMRGAALAATTIGTGWPYRQIATPSRESQAGEKIANSGLDVKVWRG